MDGSLSELILREMHPKRHRAEAWLARSAQARMTCSNCTESGEECRVLASRIHCKNLSCRQSDNICSRRTQELYERIGKSEPVILRDVPRGDFDQLVNEIYRKEQLILSDSSAGEEVEVDDTGPSRRTSDPSVVRIPRAARPMPLKNKKRNELVVEIPRPLASARHVPIDIDVVDESSQSTSDDDIPDDVNFAVSTRSSNRNQTWLKIAEKTLEATEKNLEKEKERTTALDSSNTRLKIEVKELKSDRKSLLKRIDTLEKQIAALQAEDSKTDNNEVLQEYMQINLERSKLAQAKESAQGHAGCPFNEAVDSHMKVLDNMAVKCFSKLDEGISDMAGIRVVSKNASSAGRAKGPPSAKRLRLE
ncbi:hypothetical protein BDZ89DRAFT_537333 [Hymenopellis radicata]|nr:hypothetical protein BDZ89DRAFT_537333 [Hymenopellis radicata]